MQSQRLPKSSEVVRSRSLAESESFRVVQSRQESEWTGAVLLAVTFLDIKLPIFTRLEASHSVFILSFYSHVKECRLI